MPPRAKTLEVTIGKLLESPSLSAISVAVAYSTVSGVRKLYEIAKQKHPRATFRWLLGLDDFITQPGAIEFCRSLPGAQVRLYSSKSRSLRFHPKLFLFDSSRPRGRSSMMVGSANLTTAALSRNCEAVAIIYADDANESIEMRAAFDSLWRLGFQPTELEILAYKKQYERCRKIRKVLTKAETLNNKREKAHDVLKSDAAEKDPSTANVCWIEVGKNTAMGRELEFKAEQALFFGLDSGSKKAEMREFKLSNGMTVSLRLKYQQSNSMWRLQMTNDVPEVAVGLRPKRKGRLGRSFFAAIIRRTKAQRLFTLAFEKVKSKSFASIRRRSQQLGTIGSTTTREYGWY